MTNYRLQKQYETEKHSSLLSYITVFINNIAFVLPLPSQFLFFCKYTETATQIRSHGKVKEVEGVR